MLKQALTSGYNNGKREGVKGESLFLGQISTTTLVSVCRNNTDPYRPVIVTGLVWLVEFVLASRDPQICRANRVLDSLPRRLGGGEERVTSLRTQRA